MNLSNWEETILDLLGRSYEHKFSGIIYCQNNKKEFDLSDLDFLTGLAVEIIESAWWSSIPERDEPLAVSGEIEWR